MRYDSRVKDSTGTAPTTTGAWAGVDKGVSWTFEAPAEHWQLHDARELAYWRTRSTDERLAQAAWYRVRVHGAVPKPTTWSWRFLPPA